MASPWTMGSLLSAISVASVTAPLGGLKRNSTQSTRPNLGPKALAHRRHLAVSSVGLR